MWVRMTIDEYADFEIAGGATVTRVDGIWWKAVRPFFYQPLFPFQEIVPNRKKPPLGAMFGGFQHLVPSDGMANSCRNFFIWDDVRNYSIETLTANRRKATKKGLRYFSIQELTDRDEFIAAGYPVYRSFYERTKYDYKKERTGRDYFTRWAQTLYRFPKLKIIGAYRDRELAAIDISYLVENVLIEATFFSKTEHLKDHVVDVMAHAVREKAASCPRIAVLFKGFVSGHKGVDESKLIRGCTILSKPAYYRLNPAAHYVLTTFMKNSYEKLLGSRNRDLYKPPIEKERQPRICETAPGDRIEESAP